MVATQPDSTKVLKTTALILAVLGILLLVVSWIPFENIRSSLGLLEADGSFDSLTLDEFNGLDLVIRITGFLLLSVVLFIYFLRSKLDTRIHIMLQAWKSISIRDDLAILKQTFYSGKHEIIPVIGLALITLLGLMLRLIQLQRPVGYDEAYTFMHFASRALRYVITDYSGPNNHIFHSLLVYISYHLFGNHLWTLRLPALLAGVICIPVGYLTGKRLYNQWAGLMAAVGLALMPLLVDYSINARGYTLICLFSCLGLWLTAEILKKSTFTSWLFLLICCALGFYSIPTFLYPFGIIFLWLFFSALLGETGGLKRISFLKRWFFWGVMTVIAVLILYSPVIIFGTGLSSIIGNEFVQSLTWSDFSKTILARIPKVWAEWWEGVSNWIVLTGVAGFFLSLLLHWKSGSIQDNHTGHKLPVVFPAILWISFALVVQRVVPLARVWMFLLVFYILWAAAGLSYIIQWLSPKIRLLRWAPSIIVFALVGVTLTGYLVKLTDPSYNLHETGFDYSAAKYIQENLTDQDTILAVAPGSIRVGYYLFQLGVPYSRYYDRARPEDINQAYIIVIEKSKYGTPESIITFHHLEDQLDITQAKLVFKQKRMEVYFIGVTDDRLP